MEKYSPHPVRSPPQNPPLLLFTPSPTADHTRYFRVAPNHLGVVTNVDHMCTRSRSHENHDRALLAFTQLRGVKARGTDTI